MKKICLLCIVCITVILSSCDLNKKIEYYSETSNYVTAAGVVSHLKYTEEKDALYLGFEQLSPDFSDNSFKIVGENLLVVQQKGIDQKLEIGDQVEFISAPRYFGDGYTMPIVGLIVNGEELLSFEEGYNNFLEWLSRTKDGIRK